MFKFNHVLSIAFPWLQLHWIFLCSFIGRLFSRALDKSRPKSVLVNSLTVCISLLDPKRQAPGSYLIYSNRFTQGSRPVANPGTVDGMLDSLGNTFILALIIWLLDN